MTQACSVDIESAERYVAGHMPEDEQGTFEDHFFSCDACLKRIQGLQTLQRVLAATPVSATTSVVSRVRYTWLAAAAAAVLVAGTVWQTGLMGPARTGAIPQTEQSQAAQPASPAPVPAAPTAPVQMADARIAQMAAIVPPRYASMTTRSAEDADAAAFGAAMSHYSGGRYDEAVAGLRSLTSRAPRLGHAQFFLGISELMTGDTAAARAALRRASGSGEQPYADESHFYLAKAALRAGDNAEALRELKIAVNRDAGPDGEAARLLKELQSLPK